MRLGIPPYSLQTLSLDLDTYRMGQSMSPQYLCEGDFLELQHV